MRRILSLLLVMLAIACASACAQTFVPLRSAGGSMSLNETLAELDAAPCPEGVDAALWAELKEALGEALKETGRAGVSPANHLNHGRDARATKVIATPPEGEDNAVNDLAITNDGGSPHLAWRYRNEGDYDQNGTVGIADLTPIAMHFGEAYDLIMEQNSLAAVIDGSGNGKVDIADVTAIAVGFGVNCAAYKIQNATTSTSTAWTDLAEVVQESGTGDGRLEYGTTVDAGAGVVPSHARGGTWRNFRAAGALWSRKNDSRSAARWSGNAQRR